MSTFRAVLWSFALLASQMGWGAAPLNLADFESATDRIGVSEGREFPGARGRYERSPAAARSGEHGGRLHFDFSAGGRYVALILPLPAAPEVIADQANALEGWVRRPAGHELAFRYTDAAGQTFQRPIECRPDDWARIVVPFGGWTGHWGGANDGHVRGGPVSLALLVEAGEGALGQVDFDDLRLVWQTDLVARVRHVPYRFLPAEGWSLRAQGPAGTSRLNGRMLRLDYTQGAQSFAVAPPDRVLPGDLAHAFHDVPPRAGHWTAMAISNWPPRPARPRLGMVGRRERRQLHGPAPRWGDPIRTTHPPGRGRTRTRRDPVQASCPASKRLPRQRGAGRGKPEEPRFRFTARALTDEPMAVVRWELRNWEGHSLDQGARARTGRRTPPTCRVSDCPYPRPLAIIEIYRGRVSTGSPGPGSGPRSGGLGRAPSRTKATRCCDPIRPSAWAPISIAIPATRPVQPRWNARRESGPGRGGEMVARRISVGTDRTAAWRDSNGILRSTVVHAKRHGIQVYAIVAYWSGWTSRTPPRESTITCATSKPWCVATAATSVTGKSGTNPTSFSGRARRISTPSCSRKATPPSRPSIPTPRSSGCRPPASISITSNACSNSTPPSTSSPSIPIAGR
jgi:hypothetical protein